MTRITTTLRSTVTRTGRLQLAASAVDYPLTGETVTDIDVDLPLDEHPWTVGLIVGPSGSGKTTVAKHAWPDTHAATFDWPTDRAVIDAFPEELTASQVTDIVSRVGLGSVPSWIRPFHCLSTGEQFRVSMARCFAEARPGRPVVVDEFTSVVDRQVAKVTSHTVGKLARKRGQQFVALSCHYDVTDWLQPDWVLDMSTRVFTWRCLQPRPRVDLDIHQVHVDAWPLFRAHHYLSGDIHRAARCFAAFCGDTPVAFSSYLHLPHPHTRNVKLAHRIVVLPDWQGLGISLELSRWVGDRLAEQGFRYRIASSHPAMVASMARSPRWRNTHSSIGFVARGASKMGVSRHRTIRQAG
jgi:energy-coupling factor transporter ATP-binding protein EcfA2